MKNRGRKRGLFLLLCTVAFVVFFFGLGIVFKLTYDQYSVNWTDEIGKIYTDIEYASNFGTKQYHKFDLYVPADNSKTSYGLIVYLHPGGFTTGNKSGDVESLKCYAAKGYVTAGINYTLKTDENTNASIYS